MKIRNLPFNELNEREQKVVIKHFNEMHKVSLVDNEPFFECENHELCNTINGFWEVHREADTDDGEYDGWAE